YYPRYAGARALHSFPTRRSSDLIERAPRCAAVLDVPRLYIKRKEFSVEAALLHPLEAGAIRRRRTAAQIVIVIRHRRGDVVVRVDRKSTRLNSSHRTISYAVFCL